jgi:hypothetical protein
MKGVPRTVAIRTRVRACPRQIVFDKVLEKGLIELRVVDPVFVAIWRVGTVVSLFDFIRVVAQLRQ